MLYLINILLLFIAYKLRSYGINWDQGYHLHPDERMLIMVTERIHFFDKLNPDFFNYGSLPIYILKGTAQLLDLKFGTDYSNYNGMLNFGRHISIFFDLGTVYLIYKIAALLFKNKTIALFSSFFYVIAFFPIQNSHFFVVDVFLTFFTILLIFKLLQYIKLPSMKRPWARWYQIVIIGIVFAAMLATKFTAIIFYPIIVLVMILKLFTNNNHEPDQRSVHGPALPRRLGGSSSGLTIKQLAIDFFTFNFSLLIFNFLFMPYAFLTRERFFSDIKEQIKMNSDPYIFPFTLQYVDTLPYLYYLKNIFFWGLGPFVSILSIVGLIYLLKNLIGKDSFKIKFPISNFQFPNKYQISNNQYQIIFLLFYLFYFLVVGRSAVKFMRYMLPIYPFLTIMAGFGLYQIGQMSFLRKQAIVPWIPTFVGMTLTVIWTLMFVNIYSQKHTRIAATEWINQNIPKGSTIALEHWDDGLPLTGGENYTHVELTLYDQPDEESKWIKQNEILSKADYLIIASNRLYIPLQKLSDCKKYKSCYPKTAEYYQKLFNEQLGFKKVAIFESNPQLQILNFKFQISDQSADESFTVYDHPKIFIFKKN